MIVDVLKMLIVKETTGCYDLFKVQILVTLIFYSEPLCEKVKFTQGYKGNSIWVIILFYIVPLESYVFLHNT